MSRQNITRHNSIYISMSNYFSFLLTQTHREATSSSIFHLAYYFYPLLHTNIPIVDARVLYIKSTFLYTFPMNDEMKKMTDLVKDKVKRCNDQFTPGGVGTAEDMAHVGVETSVTGDQGRTGCLPPWSSSSHPTNIWCHIIGKKCHQRLSGGIFHQRVKVALCLVYH